MRDVGTLRNGEDMPETIRPVEKLRRQAIQTLAALEQELATRERELMALKDEAARWQGALGRRPLRKEAAGALGRGRRAGRRVDWNAVLAELPATFTAKDVAAKADKPIQQVYVYLGRWMKAQKVKKAKDGYQKVAASR